MSSSVSVEKTSLPQNESPLLKESSRFGCLRLICTTFREPVFLLQELYTFDESKGWPDRLLLNYLWICRQLPAADYDNIHYHAGSGVHFLAKLLLKLDKTLFPEKGSVICRNLEQLKKELISIYATYTSYALHDYLKLPLARQVPAGTKLGIFILPFYMEGSYDKMLDYLSGEQVRVGIMIDNPRFTDSVFVDSLFLLPHYTNSMFDLLLERLSYLKEKAPVYVERIHNYLEIQLGKVSSRLNTSQLFAFTRLGFKLVKGVDAAFLDQLSPLAKKLTRLENRPTLLYYLGFDPRDKQVPLTSIAKALQSLSRLGPAAYAREVIPVLYNHPYSCPVAGPCEEYDLMLNKISDCLPFDLISFHQNELVWHLTRFSFEHTLTSGTNPYNRIALPKTALNAIQARLKIAKSLKLPNAAPLVDLLENLANTEPEEKKAETTPAQAVSRLQTAEDSEGEVIDPGLLMSVSGSAIFERRPL